MSASLADVAPIRRLAKSAFVLCPAIFLAFPALAQQDQFEKAEQSQETQTLPLTHEPAAATVKLADQRKSLELVVGGTLIRFGGFAKVDFIQDIDFVGNQDQFKVNSIPVSGDPNALLGGGTNVSAKQTRFSMEVVNDTDDGRLRAYIEGDFFGSGNSFRLRHGYGEWRGLLGGQTWTTFQDITARPVTLDYEGPDSEVFVRQAMLRYTSKTAGGNDWAVAVEDPTSEISVATGVSGIGRSEFPDVVARFRLNESWGHMQFAGIVRQLRFVSDDGALDETANGFGVNVSGRYKVGNDALMGHVAFGSGLGHYIESFSGTNSDAVVTPAGSLDTLDAWAWTLAYRHQWNRTLSSTVSGGIAEIDNAPSQGPTAIATASSARVNLVHDLNDRFLIGAELMWGERKNNDGSSGDAIRLQISAQYGFR
jgi:hypothetical protein